MKPIRIIALVLGCLLVVPAVVALVSGIIMSAAYATQRDDGYFDVTLDTMETDTAAITAEQIDLEIEPGTPRWITDALETDVRLRVTNTDGERAIFVGIADETDLDSYLAGVAHDEIDQIDNLEASYRSRSGSQVPGPPADEGFWEASATGVGTQELEWEARSGRWAVAVMNADGGQDLRADVNVGIRSAAFLPAALTVLALGVIGAVVAVTLIVFGGRGVGVSPAAAPEGRPLQPAHGAETGAAAQLPAAPSHRPYPLVLEAELDPQLSNWKWLVKWFLSIPHLIILGLLWIAFALLTVVAGFAILFTGRYPRGIFDFNLGVLRWSWRVSYYAFSGGLGTDRYPPFSLGAEPDYPAHLDLAYPEQLSRGLVLIKWWLLALPHYVIVAVIAGAGFGWQSDDGFSTVWGPGNGGLVGILTLVAAVILLFSRSYPQQLFNLIIGMNRWVYRVTAYAALMTDEYPPFRLDQGGSEPGGGPEDQPSDTPSSGSAETEQAKTPAAAATS